LSSEKSSCDVSFVDIYDSWLHDAQINQRNREIGECWYSWFHLSADSANIKEAPWGTYKDAGTTFVNGQWQDQSGNNRHALGNPTVPGNHLHFEPSNTMKWPSGSIPSSFTIFVRARYSPSGGSRGRIFQSTSSNWLLGWWHGQAGVAHFDGWRTHPWNGVSLRAAACDYVQLLSLSSRQPG